VSERAMKRAEPKEAEEQSKPSYFRKALKGKEVNKPTQEERGRDIKLTMERWFHFLKGRMKN
jgi:hypothetical protein